VSPGLLGAAPGNRAAGSGNIVFGYITTFHEDSGFFKVFRFFTKTRHPQGPPLLRQGFNIQFHGFLLTCIRPARGLAFTSLRYSIHLT
jgi:hypothetical protein